MGVRNSGKEVLVLLKLTEVSTQSLLLSMLSYNLLT